MAKSGACQDKAHLLLGVVLFKSGQFEQAIALYQDRLREQPSRESCSLMLFHSLWAAGRIEEALAEMKRFLAEYESMEYRRLIRDFKAEGYEIP